MESKMLIRRSNECKNFNVVHLELFSVSTKRLIQIKVKADTVKQVLIVNTRSKKMHLTIPSMQTI